MLCIVLNRVIAIQVWARGIAKKDITMPVYQVSAHFKELKCYLLLMLYRARFAHSLPVLLSTYNLDF
jgi:hypothetical protein